MDGGRLHCLIAFFTYNALLLPVFCLHDVDASECKRQIGKVRETVVLSSDLPVEELTEGYWIYDGVIIADKNGDSNQQHRFMGRLKLNPTDYSLTIKKLTVNDSGEFNFISSDKNDVQRDTFCIILEVQEFLLKRPELNIVTIDWHAVNKSCTVGLQCSSPSHTSVSYKWTVKKQTHRGSTVHFSLKPQDGDTTFICTISNSLNNTSASETLKCSDPSDKPEKIPFVLVLGVAGGSCLILVVIVGIIVVVCHRNQRSPVTANESIYADINDNGTSSTMTPCSVYETIDNRVSTDNTVIPKPQTVYDQIQLSRVSP